MLNEDTLKIQIEKEQNVDHINMKIEINDIENLSDDNFEQVLGMIKTSRNSYL